MGQFHQFLTELAARHTSVGTFPDDNLSKYQWTGLEVIARIYNFGRSR